MTGPGRWVPGGVAAVLGAGGPVGYAFHAGVLAALADAGWDARGADLVVGTSIGAVTAGLLRAGMAPADMLARVERRPPSREAAALLERAGGWPELPAPGGEGRWGRPAAPGLLAELARHPRRIRLGLLLAGLANAGSVDTAPIADRFDAMLGPSWPGRGSWICAVDLDTGRRVVFGAAQAPAVSPGLAVAASCAVPSYFAPVEADGRRFIDGGVHSPSNTDLVGGLVGAGAPAAVVLSLPMGLSGDPGRRGVDLPGRRLNSAGAAAGLAPLVRVGVPVLTLAPTARELEVMGYDAFDMGHLGEVAARARRSTAERLAGPDGRWLDAASAVLNRAPGRAPAAPARRSEPTAG